VNPRAGLDDVEKRKFLTLPGLNCTFTGTLKQARKRWKNKQRLDKE
jgi:hypothetical protein